MDRKRALAVSAAIAMGVVGVASAFAGVAVRSGSTSDIAASLSGNNREPVVVEVTEYVTTEPPAPASTPTNGTDVPVTDAVTTTTTIAPIQESLNALVASGASTAQSVVNSLGSTIGSYVNSVIKGDDDDHGDDRDHVEHHDDDNDEDDDD